MKTKIGIPRALAYYAYYPMWKTFFEELGCEIVLSPETNKEILDLGVKEAVNDACIPIKLFHGHVSSLQGKVDYIFLPRLISMNTERTVTFCPKFLGLPDMIAALDTDLPPLLDMRFDFKKGKKQGFKGFYEIGKQLKHSYWAIKKAFQNALHAQYEYEKLLAQRVTVQEALAYLYEGKELSKPVDYSLKFAVLGYPYAVHDRFLSVDIINQLRKMGVTPLTADMVSSKRLAAQAQKLPKDLFWTFSNQVIRAALYYLDEEKVDGIIHVTAFGCGPDAMVDKLIELEAKARGHVPFISISVDEHTGEAGVQTRLEAFVDMIKLRREQ
ncbi:MAG TPA: 2-hydroxyglutaryl-CoA dehydratase [Clostridia bacterium]|nr:2-hydroxyglutaryl-CoA dehydratase [Clostridia bacterium]